MTDLLSLLKEPLVLDGSMSTPLEAWGEQTNTDLWTAEALLDHPERVYKVHYEYFKAGARMTITDTYQTSIPAFEKHGLSASEARGLMEKAAEIALKARDDYEERTGIHNFVAGSVGPYGAYLADGSEYRGDYLLSRDQYVDFHAPRIEELVKSEVDCLAIETQPRLDEVQAILAYLKDQYPEIPVYVSFSLKDPETISEGTPLTAAIQAVQDDPQVFAAGINCFKLEWGSAAVKTVKSVAKKPVVIYPNSGAEYDPEAKAWKYPAEGTSFGAAAKDWLDAGATIVGGCCTTMPSDIAKVNAAVKKLEMELE